MKTRFLLGFAACLLLPAISRADVPFTPAIRETIRAVSSASIFPIDLKEETAFLQKNQRPALTKKSTDKERVASGLQFIQDQEDFLATQRKNTVVLTDAQWKELAAILQDEALYFQGCFSVGEPKVCAVEARSTDGTLTIVVGYSLLSILTPGAQDSALLNEQGMARLKAWKESVGISGKD